MKIETVKITEVKLNPNNPRLIKDDNFKKLVKSVIDFPEMLNIRPIVVNDDMIILGGNMRFKACKEAGLKEIPIIKASNLSEDKQREFLIKDNVSGGEWDFDLLKEWDNLKLEEWGLEIPNEKLTLKHGQENPKESVMIQTLNNSGINPIKEEVKPNKSGLILTEKHQEDVRYRKASVVSVGNLVEGLNTKQEIYYDK